MSEILTFLNQNSGALTVIFTGIVTLSTVVYAMLTGFLVNETRKMRHAQTEPRIDITHRSRDEWIALIDIVVKNIGLGPAYDVRFDINPLTGGDAADGLVAELKERNYLHNGVRYMSPGQEVTSFFTNVNDNFDAKMGSQVSINVSYKNATGTIYNNEYLIDLSELKGIKRIGEPPLYKISKNIEEIKKDIRHFATGFRRLKTDVYTSDDRMRAEEERKANQAELMKNQEIKNDKK